MNTVRSVDRERVCVGGSISDPGPNPGRAATPELPSGSHRSVHSFETLNSLIGKTELNSLQNINQDQPIQP